MVMRGKDRIAKHRKQPKCGMDERRTTKKDITQRNQNAKLDSNVERDAVFFFFVRSTIRAMLNFKSKSLQCCRDYG